MPIYEYKCKGCEKEFEVMQRITADPMTKCKDCGGNLDKLISQSAFVLKGTGWYQTDFAGKPPANNNDNKPTEATPKEATPKEAGPKEAGSKEAGSKEATPKEATPKEATPKETKPKESAPADSASSPAVSGKKD